MAPRHLKWVILISLIGICHWFFGNLYEAIVISPNWVVDTATQLTRLNELFVCTSPTLYFVPVTQLATLAGWLALALNRRDEARPTLRRAALFLVLDQLLNALVVSTVILQVFGPNFSSLPDPHALVLRWNILNVARMALTAAAASQLFQSFRVLDRVLDR